MRFFEAAKEALSPIDAELKQRAERGFNLDTVLKHLIDKNNDPSNAEEIKPMLLFPGGGMKVANSGGFLLALNEKKLLDKFNTVAAVSAASMLSAYALAGQTELVADLFFENAPHFVKWQKGLPKIDVDFVSNLMAQSKYRLNIEALRAARANFYIAVADKTGNCEFLDGKNPNLDLLAAIKASMAAPFFYEKTVQVDNQELADPLIDQLPLSQAVERFRPTDVLVLENSSFYLRAKPYSKFLNSVLAAGKIGLPNAANEFLDRPSYRKDFEGVERSLQTTLGVLFPPPEAEKLGALETNPQVLRNSAMICKQKALQLLEKI